MDKQRFTCFRDPATDVMYLQSSSLAVMLDPGSGFPLTYTNYLKLAEKKFLKGVIRNG